ncbi:serine/threonine-protein kinase [soil metagenome]
MAADVSATAGDDRIGNYRFVRVLQMGQNSAIMEVAQEGTGKRFAMKQLLPSKSEDRQERKVFAFEAKLGQELRHPNLGRVHEFVNDKYQPYFVMDYFVSVTLRQVIGRPMEHALPKGRSHTVIRQSAEALAYMHEKGWAHRDIKPENMLVNRSGEVRLIDYALAKRIPKGLAKVFSMKPPREGTYSYIAPEVILRQPPSALADIYSFGITCYEIGCGRQPFRANSPQELLTKHVSDKAIPPTTYNPNVTKEFSDIVMKMIQKKPQDRIQDLREFASHFARIRILKDDPDPLGDRLSM